MSYSKDTFLNNNTKKGIGFDYQKLIALEYCINAKNNESIWIECFGDVANETSSVEIKHHLESHNITSNSEDVWKTLKNYAVEFEKIIDNDTLILFTTSSINDDSIFYKWNEKTPNTKYTILQKHIPADGIAKYKEEFFKKKKTDLIPILKKFYIFSEQPNIIEKSKELKENPFFSLIPDELKDSALESAYGYISLKAIDNFDKWEINSNDFKKDMRFTLMNFTQNHIPFPLIQKEELNETELNKRDFLFIEKLKKIDVKENDQANAVEDYIKANLSIEKLLRITPTIKSNLEVYDEEIERNLKDEKSYSSYNLSKEDLDSQKSKIASRNVFFNCLRQEHTQIINVTNTQKYYRNGRIHDIVENNKFDWEFKDTDL
ncbi:ABC-three component system protein [Flavobacterium sp.]|uniref:ABC-three component system protein n=1 Tax=Flavobacterium sp. TaxID=239 RepID=UPI0022C4879F|nr:ABC-three component system protein [Flavobacterium sp.]MCZ8090291.1 hypothetical protein [Flavobacterium sp.]